MCVCVCVGSLWLLKGVMSSSRGPPSLFGMPSVQILKPNLDYYLIEVELILIIRTEEIVCRDAAREIRPNSEVARCKKSQT